MGDVASLFTLHNKKQNGGRGWGTLLTEWTYSFSQMLNVGIRNAESLNASLLASEQAGTLYCPKPYEGTRVRNKCGMRNDASLECLKAGRLEGFMS